MKAERLREKFSEVYAELYQKCQIVCSAPSCFFWTGENLVQYGVPAVMQKLPTRIYVGFENLKSKQIEYGTWKMYDSKKDAFVDVDIEPAIKRAMASLNDVLKEEQYDITSGSRIHLIVESIAGSGNSYAMTTIGAVSAAIAACIIAKYTDANARELSTGCLRASGSAFERVLRLAWRLTTVEGCGRAIGGGADIFCALVPGLFPQLFVPRPCFRILGNHPDIGAPAVAARDYSKAQTRSFCAVSVSDITGPTPAGAWPFDFGLLYSGLPKRSLDAISFEQHWKSFWKSSFDDIMSRCITSSGASVGWDQWPYIAPLGDVTQQVDRLWEEHLDLATILSLRLFATLVDLFRGGPSAERMRNLVTYMNGFAFYSRSSEAQSFWMDYLSHRVVYMIFQRLAVTMGMKFAGSGSGGGFLFVAPPGILRDYLSSLVEEIREESGRDVDVEYASWIDGYEEDGLRIEQNIGENIIASNVRKGYIRVTVWRGQGRPETMVLPESELDTLVRQWELVADLRNHAVYVAGVRVTTEHGLRSAKYTCQLLERLLAEPTLEIAAEEMPAGSYALERSELQGKIVSPLTHVIRERTGKTLKLSVKVIAGIPSLQLHPCNVSVCVLA